MIQFNNLLKDEGIDPSQVKLVRHQDTRKTAKLTPYQLWLAADGRYELYQSIQRRPVFQRASMIASFVATPLNETMFVGMYEKKGVANAKKGLIDPASGRDAGGDYYYNLVLSTKLDVYKGRLVIAWGPGYRSWVQNAWQKEKPIVEIRRTVTDPPFPGFLNFREKLSTLAAVPQSWRNTLTAVSGVYLFINPDNGKEYVGKASGAEGFWGRWEQYVASGHGGNRKMMDVPKADYQVSILEVASSSASSEAICDMENRWKEKLLTRKFGLNGN